jgi:hypothetical protein
MNKQELVNAIDQIMSSNESVLDKGELIAQAIAAVKLEQPYWAAVENEAARYLRLAEKFWIEKKSEMEFAEFILYFLSYNYDTLLEPSYTDDYIVGEESNEESVYGVEYSVAV